ADEEERQRATLPRLNRDQEGAIREAFEVRLKDKELRPADLPENLDRHLIGVERMLDFSYVDSLPRLRDPLVAAASHKDCVVDPDAPDDPSNGHYQSLDQALSRARPGETILVRKNGLLTIERPIRLEKAETDVTLKADSGFHPILSLAD